MRLKTYNKKIDKFLTDLEYICQENAVQIIFTNKNYVKCSGIKTSGFFDENKRVLACALKTSNTEWIATLAHESCHLDQWREKNDGWQKWLEVDIDQGSWLKHQTELSSNEINLMTMSYKELEWDCEKRTIEKIKKYNLPIDLVSYMQQAVVYVMFYDFVAKYRTWYKNGRSPCCCDAIVNQIPDDYDTNILPVITPKIEALMKDYILGGKDVQA